MVILTFGIDYDRNIIPSYCYAPEM